MGTSLKGIFKYFTQIFDEKEDEIQIGHPTDVKHVAHIGWDGSSSSDPSWMKDFEADPGLSTDALISDDKLKNSAKDYYLGETSKKPAKVEEPQPKNSKEKPKHRSRRRSSAGNSGDLDLSSNPGCNEGSSRSGRSREGSTKSGRRSTKSSTDTSSRQQKSDQGIESPADDRAGIPKPSRRKKANRSSGGEGSSRSARLKGQTNSNDELTSSESYLSSVVEENEEDKG